MFNLVRNVRAVFQSVSILRHPHRQCRRVSFSLHAHWHLPSDFLVLLACLSNDPLVLAVIPLTIVLSYRSNVTSDLTSPYTLPVPRCLFTLFGWEEFRYTLFLRLFIFAAVSTLYDSSQTHVGCAKHCEGTSCTGRPGPAIDKEDWKSEVSNIRLSAPLPAAWKVEEVRIMEGNVKSQINI